MELSQAARDLHHDSLVVDLHMDTFLISQLFGYEIRNRHQNRVKGAPVGWHVDLPRLLDAGVDMPVFGIVIKYWSSGESRRAATRDGMTSLRQDGWRLVREGRTSLEEVLRATKEEHVGSSAPVTPATPAGAANGGHG